MARGESWEKKNWSGEGDAKLPDWEGQPIRNLRSIKLEWEVRTRLSFIDARLFLSRCALSFFFFNPRSRPFHPRSFIRSSRPSSQPLFAFQGTPILPLEILWILRAFGY